MARKPANKRAKKKRKAPSVLNLGKRVTKIEKVLKITRKRKGGYIPKRERNAAWAAEFGANPAWEGSGKAPGKRRK